MIDARLPDGTLLRFPDGTADDVIDKVVRGHLGVEASSPNGQQPGRVKQVADEVARGVSRAGRAVAAGNPLTVAADLTRVGIVDPALRGGAMIADAVDAPETAQAMRELTSLPIPSQAIKRDIDDFTGGATAPRNKTERVIDAATEALATGGGLNAMKAGALAPKNAAELAGFATSGGATQAVAESGGGPMMQFVAGVLSGAAPAVAANSIKAGTNALLPKSDKALIDQSLETGRPITVGTVFGGETLPKIEAQISQSPLSGAALRSKAKEVETGAQIELSDLAEMIHPSPPSTLSGAGAQVRVGTNQAIKSVRDEMGKRFDKVIDKMPGNVKLRIPKTRQFYEELVGKYAGDEEVMPVINGGVFNKLGKPTTAREFKNLRKRIREKSNSLKTKGLTVAAGEVDELNRLLDAEIGATAAMFIPGGAKQLKEANRFASRAYSTIDDLEKFAANSSDEKLLADFFKLTNKATVKGAKGADVALMNKLNKRMPKEVMDRLAAFRLEQMGLQTPGRGGIGDVFSSRTFVTEWKSISDQAKRVLFKDRLSDDQMKALDGLARYLDGVSPIPLNASASGGAVDSVLALSGAFINPAIIVTPMVAGTSLASQSLAKAINKLPRKVLTKELRPSSRDAILQAMANTGAEVATIKEMEGILNNAMSGGLLEE